MVAVSGDDSAVGVSRPQLILSLGLRAFFSALLCAGLVFALALAVTTLMWAFQFSASLPWLPFVGSAAVVWLLAHGVPLSVTPDPAVAATLGVGSLDPFTVVLVPLGVVGLVAFFAYRRALAWEDEPVTRLVASLVGYAVAGALAYWLAGIVLGEVLAVSSVTAILVPMLGYGLGFALGTFGWTLPELFERGPGWASAWDGMRRGVATLVMLVGAGALTLAAWLGFSWADVVSLYEASQLGVVGGAAVTLAQLAVLPNAAVFVAAVFVGPGFILGTGSEVSALGASLGPLPSLPLFGALPAGELLLGFFVVLLPVLIGAAVVLLDLSRIPDAWRQRSTLLVSLAATSGVLFGLLAWLAGGSLGVGRFTAIGPDPLLTGGFFALEVLVGAAAAMLAVVPGERLLGVARAGASR